MRYELKSVRIWAFTKVSFFINLVIGFMLGLLYAVSLLFMMALAEIGGFPGGGMDPSEFPVGVMVVVLPLMGAMFAAVFHTIAAVMLIAIYNLIVRMIGGLEFDLDAVKIAPVAAPMRPMAAHTGIPEATVSVPSVNGAPPKSTLPPPPPTVPGVADTAAPSGSPAPHQPVIEIPEAPAAPPLKPTTTDIEPPPPTLQPKPPDDKTDNDPPPAPETT